MFQDSAPENAGTGGTPKRKGTKALWIVLAVILAAAGLTFGALCYLSASSTDIFPNTYIMGIPVGGLSREEAVSALTRDMEGQYAGKSLTVRFPNGDITISAEDAKPEIDEAAAAEAAYRYGRQGNITENAVTYLFSLFQDHTVDTEFSVDQDYINQQISYAAERNNVAMLPYSYVVSRERLLITKGRTGRTVNEEGLREAVYTAFQTGNFDPVACELSLAEPDPIDLASLQRQIYTAPSDAYFDGETQEIVSSITGVNFDLAQAQTLLDNTAAGQVAEIDLILTEPEMTTEELETVLFQFVLGECTTSVSGTAARISNVKLAASIINGKIIMPGGVFSYNETVGKRTVERGFQAAPAYVNGLTVDEIGGGVCQVSSTLYLATLRSNLEIVTRYCHTYRVAYMPYGMDATVSWGGPDYEFKNNTDYPIKIYAKEANNSLTIQLIGTKTDDTTVKMEYKILATIPYETIEKTDSTLAPGTKKVDITGYTGYKVETYRCLYDGDGNLISRTFEASSNYKKRDKVVLVGPVPVSTSPEPSSEPAVEPVVTDQPEASPEATPETTPSESPAPSETPETGGETQGA
ncbi:VanW family protein [Papillibacter cinnamivorans]|nr:VanW family protein [Papillibacter cinnamivorans]